MDNRYDDRGADLQPDQQPVRQAPQSSWQTPQPSWQEVPVYHTVNTAPSQPPKQKRSRKALKFAALALALVLLGGLGGGAVTSLILHRQQTAAAETAAVEPAQPAAQGAEALPAERVLPETGSEPSVQTGIQAPSEAGIGAAAASEPRDTDVRTVLPLISGDDTVVKTPAEIYAGCVESVVSIKNTATTTNVFGQTSSTPSSGSGFIVSADGYIITNYHVIENADSLEVTLTSGETYPAEVIGYDKDNADVALIKIEASGLSPVAVGDSDNLAVGEQVVAIGNPLGELTNTLTVGYISALDRVIAVEANKDLNVMQTDCAINPGNSGGPLFDMHGNVIGITTAKFSSSTVEGIGFVIPINDVTSIIGDLMEYGYVTGRPWLGVNVRNLSSDVTAYYGMSGIYVASVVAGSAAEQAGVQAGDIITAMSDTTLSTTTELTAALKNYKAGDIVTLSILRNGVASTLTVTLDDKHDAQILAEQEAQAQQEEQQQQQSPFGYSLPGGLEDWFNYFYGGGR